MEREVWVKRHAGERQVLELAASRQKLLAEPASVI